MILLSSCLQRRLLRLQPVYTAAECAHRPDMRADALPATRLHDDVCLGDGGPHCRALHLHQPPALSAQEGSVLTQARHLDHGNDRTPLPRHIGLLPRQHEVRTRRRHIALRQRGRLAIAHDHLPRGYLHWTHHRRPVNHHRRRQRARHQQDGLSATGHHIEAETCHSGGAGDVVSQPDNARPEASDGQDHRDAARRVVLLPAVRQPAHLRPANISP